MNVIHLVSNKEWGGGERYTLDLCKALRADGHQVQIFARNIKAVREPFEHAGIPVTTMRLGGVWDVLSPVRLSSRLSRIDGPIVVHVHNFKDAYTAIAARRMARNSADIRIVATRHLVKKAGTDPHHLRIYDGLDAIIFVSRLAYEEFLSSRPQVNRSKLHVVLNSLALEPYDRRDKRSGDPSVNLIFAGRITPEKGHEELVRALGTLKDLDWQLEVCGTGRGRDVMPVVALSTLLGIDDRIVWSGYCTDVPARMARADIGVFPSVWREPFGLTILEAFSRYLPVITTDNGAQREIIDEGETGLLVPPADPDALASALRSLITDPDLRRRIGDNAGKAYRSGFSYSKFYNSILSIYNNEC